MIESSVFIESMLSGLYMVIRATWWLWIALVLFLIGKLIYSIMRKRRLAASGIEEIDTMDGKTFEKYMEVLFDRLGYKVERTRYVGDYGADLVVQSNGIRTVIQVKRYNGKVNIKAIQEAVAAKGIYSCSEAMVATNSYFTKAAVELARANNVELWDRDKLADAMLKVKVKEKGAFRADSISGHAVVSDSEASKICAACGKVVSDKVLNYCLENSDRFNGQILCYEHQRS